MSSWPSACSCNKGPDLLTLAKLTSPTVFTRLLLLIIVMHCWCRRIFGNGTKHSVAWRSPFIALDSAAYRERERDMGEKEDCPNSRLTDLYTLFKLTVGCPILLY